MLVVVDDLPLDVVVVSSESPGALEPSVVEPVLEPSAPPVVLLAGASLAGGLMRPARPAG